MPTGRAEKRDNVAESTERERKSAREGSDLVQNRLPRQHRVRARFHACARLEARPSQKRPQDLRALSCATHLRAFFAAGAPLAAPLAASPHGCAGSKLRVPSHTVVQAPPSRVRCSSAASMRTSAAMPSTSGGVRGSTHLRQTAPRAGSHRGLREAGEMWGDVWMLGVCAPHLGLGIRGEMGRDGERWIYAPHLGLDQDLGGRWGRGCLCISGRRTGHAAPSPRG